MTIALHADNEKKSLLENFCIAYKHILEKCRLIATEATAEHIYLATGLEIKRLLAGGLGGDKQMESAILNDAVDLLISFEQVSLDTYHETADHNALIRLCDLCSVPVATNIPTAECLILSLARGDLDWRTEFKNQIV
ncbi:MAG: methylglyoxal synthase [Lachnospiraceae bacterium]|nr:methylglyoxal synthase [Lachnospiraceae bacterium]